MGKKGTPDNKAALTQLVECLAVNQNVVGSSPASGVRFLHIFQIFVQENRNTCKNFIIKAFLTILHHYKNNKGL